MFALFPKLPSEIRGQIWLATLGSMTIAFPYHDPVLTWQGLTGQLGSTDETPPPAQEPCRRVRSQLPGSGYVVLADGSSRVDFVVKSTASYLTCTESREFLQFFFRQSVPPGGGLPTWFCPDVDTIECTDTTLDSLGNHVWFAEIQHLVLNIWDSSRYFSDHWYMTHERMKGNHWVYKNFHSLKTVSFDIKGARRYGDPDCLHEHWLDEWFYVFVDWYCPDNGEEPQSFYARVISSEVPKREWLTPWNFLCVYKQVRHEQFQHAHPGEPWEVLSSDEELGIPKATEEELSRPGDYLTHHRRRVRARRLAEEAA